MLKILLALSLLSVSAICAPKTANPGAESPANRSGSAPASALSSSGLDTGLVRKYYQEGDFERAIPILENLMKSKRELNHADSVFVFKHLGVMYAASENTRERGKYYMLQLLHIEPTARIMDMYASDMIYMIFRNIQEEFYLTRTKMERAEALRAANQAQPGGEEPTTPPARKKPAQAGSSRKAFYWIGAVTALAGVGVATYALTQDEPVTTKPHIVE